MKIVVATAFSAACLAHAAAFAADSAPATAPVATIGQPAVAAGTGRSFNIDAKAAGAEAALQAKTALAASSSAAPSVVLVMASTSVFKPELIDGIASVFPDKTKIYGALVLRPIASDDPFSAQPLGADKGHGEVRAGVSILVLSDAVTVTSASADAKSLPACGEAIGKALAPAMQAAAPGSLIFTFGQQPFKQNPPYLDALLKAIGKPVPIVGISAKDNTVIVAGEIKKGVNAALLLRGNFAVTSEICEGSGLETMDQAAKGAFAKLSGPGIAAFVMNCGGRSGHLAAAGTLPEDWKRLSANAKGTPLFGGYGHGEIGTHADGTPLAKGYCVSIAVIGPAVAK